MQDADDLVARLQRDTDKGSHTLAVNRAGAVPVVGGNVLHGRRRLKLQDPARDAFAKARLHASAPFRGASCGWL